MEVVRLAFFASAVMPSKRTLPVNDKSQMEFFGPLHGQDQKVSGKGWRRATLIKSRGEVVELLSSERMTFTGGAFFSGADYSRVSPNGRYVVLPTIKARGR